MSRLQTLSSDLVAKLRRASTAKQHAACLVACELAVAKTKTEHPLVDEALRQIRVGHVFTPQERAAIDALVGQLDEEYFNLQEAAEADKVSDTDFLRVFAKARAVAALSFAGSNTPEAAADSIYEAPAAMGDDKQGLFSLVEPALN